jgi:hypothetical protein
VDRTPFPTLSAIYTCDPERKKKKTRKKIRRRENVLSTHLCGPNPLPTKIPAFSLKLLAKRSSSNPLGEKGITIQRKKKKKKYNENKQRNENTYILGFQ